MAHTDVTAAQVDEIVGNTNRGLFKSPVRTLHVSIAFPPPKAKTISAS